MTPGEFAEKMREILPREGYEPLYDPEFAHMEADKLMCRVLRELGYEVGVVVFENAPSKWYA